jgi:hypothetical protein
MAVSSRIIFSRGACFRFFGFGILRAGMGFFFSWLKIKRHREYNQEKSRERWRLKDFLPFEKIIGAIVIF